jgi:hypothetical protein
MDVEAVAEKSAVSTAKTNVAANGQPGFASEQT